MSKVKRAGKNIFFKGVAEVMSRVVYAFFFIYMARKLGTGDFGLFSFATSFAGIFAIALDPGLNTLYVNDVSRHEGLARKYASNFLAVKAALSGFLLAAAWVSALLAGYDERTVTMILYMYVFWLLASFMDFYVALADARERMDLDALLKVTNKAVIAVVGILALLWGAGLERLVAYMVCSALLPVLFGHFLISRKVTPVGIELDWPFIRSIMKRALPIAATIVFSMIYFKIDVVMMSMFGLDNEEIGLYSSAIKLVEISFIVPVIVVGGLYPMLSSAYARPGPELHMLGEKTYQGLFLIGALAVILCSLLSREVIVLIYGEAYAGAAKVLGVVIWRTLFVFLNALLVKLVIMAEKQMLISLFSLACLALNIALNYLLIPRAGIMGAAYATVATTFAMFALNAWFCTRRLGWRQLPGYNIKPILCAVMSVLVLFPLKGLGLWPFLLLALPLYAIMVIITRVFSRADLDMIRRAFFPARG